MYQLPGSGCVLSADQQLKLTLALTKQQGAMSHSTPENCSHPSQLADFKTERFRQEITRMKELTLGLATRTDTNIYILRRKQLLQSSRDA